MKKLLFVLLWQSCFSVNFVQSNCKQTSENSSSNDLQKELNKGAFFMIKRIIEESSRPRRDYSEYYFSQVESSLPLLQIELRSINTPAFLKQSDKFFWKSLASCFNKPITSVKQVPDMVSNFSAFKNSLSLPSSMNLFSGGVGGPSYYFFMFSEPGEENYLRTIIVMIEQSSSMLINNLQLNFSLWNDAYSLVKLANSKISLPLMQFVKSENPTKTGHKLVITYSQETETAVTIEIPDEAKFGSDMPVMRIEWPTVWPEDFEPPTGMTLDETGFCNLYKKMDSIYDLRKNFSKKNKNLNCDKELNAFSSKINKVQEIWIFIHFNKMLL